MLSQKRLLPGAVLPMYVDSLVHERCYPRIIILSQSKGKLLHDTNMQEDRREEHDSFAGAQPDRDIAPSTMTRRFQKPW